MAMHEAVSFPKRVGKEFTKNAIGLLVAYAPIAAFLTLAAGTTLGGVLIFGAIAVPAMSALLTVLTVGVGGGGPYPGSRHYHYYDPGSEPILRSGGGYGADSGWHDYSGANGGGWDGGGGGWDGGGGGWDGGGGGADGGGGGL